MTKHQIKYTGPTQHTRIISAKDAEAAGFVLPEKEMEWGLQNRHTLVVENLDESALEYFQSDPDFRVKEIGADEEPKAGTASPEAQVAEESEGGAEGSGSVAGSGSRGRRTTSTTTAGT